MAIQFTESEWLILSSLAYCIPDDKFDANGFPLRGSELSVTSLFSALEEQALGKKFENAAFKTKEDKDNYLYALESLENKLKSGNYVVSKNINHNASDQSGFLAFAIEPSPNPDNEVVVCCRGSDGMSTETLNDWIGADAALAWENQTLQQKEMKDFMKSFSSYDSVYLTGHSLGGNLAMYGAISFSNPEKIKGVYSFDGPGFNADFEKKNKEKINSLYDKIHNYQNEHDLVSSSLISIGEIIILESAIEDDGRIVNHERWTIRVNKDQSLKRNKSQKKDNVCNIWNSLTKDVSKDARSPVIRFVAGLLSGVFSGVNSLFNKFKTWKFHQTNGYKTAFNNPIFEIDTTKMSYYADQLKSIASRAEKLDSKMNNLYWNLGIEWDTIMNLGKLLRSGKILDDSKKIRKCSNFLSDTAQDFDKLEKSIEKHLG